MKIKDKSIWAIDSCQASKENTVLVHLLVESLCIFSRNIFYYKAFRQWRGYGEFGGIAFSHFCQDGARDFLKIDEKIGLGGHSKSSEKEWAWPKDFHVCPHFVSWPRPWLQAQPCSLFALNCPSNLIVVLKEGTPIKAHAKNDG